MIIVRCLSCQQAYTATDLVDSSGWQDAHTRDNLKHRGYLEYASNLKTQFN